MDFRYWIKKWQKDKAFYIENDRIKEKKLFYTPFSYTNLLGFQNAEILPLLSTDVLARFNRMNNKNVLFPPLLKAICKTVIEIYVSASILVSPEKITTYR